jgi:transcriptional regulator with XRE-family HTH domain
MMRALTQGVRQVGSSATPRDATIGTRLRDARQAQGLMLQEVADLDGTTEAYLSKVERGKHVPTWRTIERITKALNLNPAVLFQ